MSVKMMDIYLLYLLQDNTYFPRITKYWSPERKSSGQSICNSQEYTICYDIRQAASIEFLASDGVFLHLTVRNRYPGAVQKDA
jgi:hypothetical protein